MTLCSLRVHQSQINGGRHRYKYKKQLQKIEREVGMEYQKEYKQGYIVRMVTKVKGRSYFFLSSVFGDLFTRH